MPDTSDSSNFAAIMRNTGEASFWVGAAGEVLCFSAHTRSHPIVAKKLCSGTFLPRGAEDGLLPLDVPATVAANEILGYVCHGALRLPVLSPDAGQIEEPGPVAGADVTPDDTLFTLEVPL